MVGSSRIEDPLRALSLNQHRRSTLIGCGKDDPVLEVILDVNADSNNDEAVPVALTDRLEVAI
jgi:hypothetical protein